MLRINIIFILFLLALGNPSELSAQFYTHLLNKLGPESALNGRIKAKFHHDKNSFPRLAFPYSWYKWDGKKVTKGASQQFFNYSLDSPIFNQFTKPYGLHSDNIFSCSQDWDDKYWLSNAFRWRTLPQFDHRSAGFLPDSSITKCGDGSSFYDSRLNGISSLPSSNLNSISCPDPKTDKLRAIIRKVADRSSYDIQIDSITEITMSPKEGLTILFPSPTIGHTSNLSYHYKFEGRGEPWQTPSGSQLNLRNMNPGSYLLKIREVENSREWSMNEATVSIDIPIPFFQSIKFYFALGAMLFCFGYCYARIRIGHLKRAAEKLSEEVNKKTLTIRKKETIIEKQAAGLKDLDQQKYSFTTTLSEELRTPLTLVIHPLQELRELEQDSPEQKELVETAFTAALQLSSMIERRINPLESGSLKNPNNESLISIPIIVEQIIKPYKEQAKSTGVKINISSKDLTTKRAFLDVDKFKNILEYLILNAIMYSRKNGKMEIDLSHQNGELSFTCKDGGGSFSAFAQEKLFTQYFHRTNTYFSGRGDSITRLTQSKEIDKSKGGELTIESRDGSGRRMHLALPCTIWHENISKAPKKEYFANSNQVELLYKNGEKKNPTLLVIEDHQMTNALLKKILSSKFHILTASDGKKGLELLEKEAKNIDLILSDWMMPNIDGPALLKAIRTHDAWKFIPLIMLTVRASKEDRIRAFRIGVDDYLSKPFDKDELITRIYNLLNKSQERSMANSCHQVQPQFSAEPSADDLWLKTLEEIVLEKMSSRNFSVIELAEDINLGERQLTRRLKTLTGLTPGNYIKECRLLKADHFLKQKKYRSVAEVCFAVGFTTPNYFSKVYNQRFGKRPSTYIRQNCIELNSGKKS